jgi:hypothetical protein
MQQVMEAHRLVIPGVPHFVISSHTPTRLSALHARCPFSLRKIPGTHVIMAIDPSTKVKLDELHNLKNPMVLPGMELATFRLGAA